MICCRAGRDTGPASVTVTGPMAANSGTVLADAARSRHAAGLHTTHHSAEGALVDALPGWGDVVPVQVVFPSARLRPPKVWVFVEAIAAALADAPWACCEIGA